MSDVSTQAAGNTPATGSAQPGATSAAPASAPAPAGAPAPAPAASQSQQATEGQPAATASAAAPAPAGQPEAQTGGDKPPAGAPEKYEFKAPNGVTLDDALVAEFSTVAKELNLPQDAAQKVLDKLAPKLAEGNVKAITSAMQKQSATWQEQVKTDKDIGGDKLDENLAVARKAVERFAPPELRALLGRFDAKSNPTGTGLGDHPAVVKLFHAIGKAISEDRPVNGTTAPSKGERDAATVLYGGTQSKASRSAL